MIKNSPAITIADGCTKPLDGNRRFISSEIFRRYIRPVKDSNIANTSLALLPEAF